MRRHRDNQVTLNLASSPSEEEKGSRGVRSSQDFRI